MKPSPEEDFPVTVWRERYEHAWAKAALFADIYRLILNFGVTVTFVPELDPDSPPSPHDDFDKVSTVGQAAWAAVHAANCAVTPSDALAGTERRLELRPAAGYEFMGDDGIPLIYASREEFAIYARELDELADRFSGPCDSKPLSEVSSYQVITFVLESIVNAAHLSSRQLELLCRAPGA